MVYIEKENIKEWINILKESAKTSKNKKLIDEIIDTIEVSSRKRRAVNLYKINKLTKDNDNIIVPRKVLSIGKLDHKVNIAALEYSDKALKMLKDSGSNIVDVKDMINKNSIHLII
ncbi:MAG: 50S ribosomal protein L18e [Candidatus Micrarchaeia archaeon]